VHRPYTRPPLSKELLAGEHEAERVLLPSETFDAQWRLGVPATKLDRAGRRVLLADGDELSYDRLILATGSRARRWPGPGGDLEGVHVLRNLDDALALRAALERRPRVVVVGAGFIGCEVAQTARKQGLDVTLVDIAPTPMLPLGPHLGEWCAALHRGNGVDLRLSMGVTAVHGTGRVEAVELSDGTRVEADLVLVGMGAQPNTEWLTDSGLQLTRGGLDCDATLTAVGDPDILGAGDIVSWPHPLAGGDTIRVEHWTVAAEQGQQAGRNVLLEAQERKPYDQPPYFWSDQYDTKIQSLGLPGRATRLERLEETEDGSRFVYGGERDGRLVGVIAVNAARRLGSYRMALANRPGFEDLRVGIAADAKRLI
jgi:3-phenylpropionate/trans-cinnamate dioxygenase ferredoxin reductase subunit